MIWNTWLVVAFVVVGVLAPAACVVWFMNAAAKSQTDSARRDITEAYRGQLRLIRDRIESYWEGRVASLEETSHSAPPARFQQSIVSGLADSAIYFDAGGSVLYPPQAIAQSADPLANDTLWRAAQTLEQKGDPTAARGYEIVARDAADPSIMARAAQGQIRTLVQHGDKEAAITAIQKYFVTGRAMQGMDLQGRLIAADEQLLALKLIKSGNARFAPGVVRLTALLNDYEHTVMPAAQRLFLMSEVQALGDAKFPTFEAERLAAQFLESDGARPGSPMLEASVMPGVWKLPAKNMLALYRTDTIVAATNAVLNQQNSSSVRFAMIPPGSPSSPESIAASPLLPGWQISFSLLDTKSMEEAARRQTVSYLWAGYLMVAAMAIVGAILAQSFRRQLRLAHLKTDLVAAVSHELKTPLASMRVLVDSLLDDVEINPKKTREYLELIAGENLRLSRLIENFLTFSRIERNRQRFDFAETNPSEVVRAAVNAMRERLQPPACHLQIDISPDLPPLHADEDALVTVLLNLLDNAHKYTLEDKRIALHAYREDGCVVFAVEDNGIGIPVREQKRIFRRFYQVDQRLARETGGCGLGLSIVEFIVRAHGGTVRVKSGAGTGSVFHVSLPYVRQGAAA